MAWGECAALNHSLDLTAAEKPFGISFVSFKIYISFILLESFS
jgi:hypothetical protein